MKLLKKKLKKKMEFQFFKKTREKNSLFLQIKSTYSITFAFFHIFKKNKKVIF